MNNSLSVKIVRSPLKAFHLAVQKQLSYFKPKGASKRVLPIHLNPSFSDNSQNKFSVSLSPFKIKGTSENNSHFKSSESLSPIKLPPIRRTRNDHSPLTKSTSIIKQLDLTSSRDSSPIKFECNGKNTLSQISGIIETCDIIAKVNQSDIFLTNRLIKNKETFEVIEEEAVIKENYFGIELSGKIKPNKRPRKESVEKLKRESFETTYFIEKTLNKNNSLKKLREKIMPWKKVIINN